MQKDQKQDYLVIGTAGDVRIYALRSTKLTGELCQRHHCSHLAAAALGRAAAGALLLDATMKDGERVGLRFKGDGPIGEVVADAENGHVRGYVGNPDLYLPPKNGKLDVGGAVGQGNLTVTRYPKEGKPFTGYCQLVNGEIAADLTQYLYTSEQTPSSVALGVMVEPDGQVIEAGGYFIQALPDCPEEVLDKLDENVHHLGNVTDLLKNGTTPEQFIELLGRGLETHLLDTREVDFKCRCSREMVKDMLGTLRAYDLRELARDENTEVHCPFCNARYVFDRREIETLLKENSLLGQEAAQPKV